MPKRVEKVEEVKKETSLFEKLTPVLLLATIVLSFFVGVLWEKVSRLEKGGVVANKPTTGTGGTAPVEAASPLSDIPLLVQNIGVDINKFKACYDSGKYKDKVQADMDEGSKNGITGTPGTFVTNGKGEVWFVPGAFPYENVKSAVETALGKTPTTALPSQIVKLTEDKAKALPRVKDTDHVRGNKTAKVVMIEYSDYQCPFCQRFHPTTTQLLKEFGNDLALVYRHFPLDQLHPLARPAAEASECVAEIAGNDAFWEFTDAAFGSN